MLHGNYNGKSMKKCNFIKKNPNRSVLTVDASSTIAATMATSSVNILKGYLDSEHLCINFH